jgi:hypothetical protein
MAAAADNQLIEYNNKNDAQERIEIPAQAIPSYRKAYVRGGWGPENFPSIQMREIGLLRSDADQIQIWNLFCEKPRLSYCGDVLSMLKGLVPYPIPYATVKWPGPVSPILAGRAIEKTEMHVNVHEGGHDNFCVDLPEHLRRAELNTDWSQYTEFNGSIPPPEVTRMLDQVCLGGTFNDQEKPFPPPFATGIEKIPWIEVGNLCSHFPPGLAVHILRDWGLILRGALSNLPREIMSALQQNGGKNIHVPRRVLQSAYETSVMEWMIQRYGKEKLLG